MKKVLIVILALLVSFASHAQITITLGNALLQNPGTDVHLPVSVKGLNGATGGIGITGMELHVSYINTSVVYDTTLNFSTMMPVSQWFFGANGVDYGTNWLEPSGARLNIPDNTVLFDIVFHYLGGTTELNFDSTRCLLVDSAFNIIPGVHFVNGRITPSLGSGESRWNGTGSWNTASNWSNGIPGDSTNAIIETGNVTVFSTAISNALTINPGCVINISPGFSLTANRNYTNNGRLNLLSDATGTGSFIVIGSVSGSGVNNFHRYLDFTSNPGCFISSPITAATTSVFGSNPAESYTESSASWMTLPAGNNLDSGKGYRVSGSVPATFTYTGPFTTGDVQMGNLSYTAGGNSVTRGLNLLGNPYPSAIQLEQGTWNRTNLDKSIYVLDGYKYVCWNGSIGSLKDGIIPAMQGFFVKANAAGASLTIPAGARLHDNQPFYKTTEAVSNVISMRIENIADTNHFDEAFVHVLSGSTTGFDNEHDAYLIPGNSSYPHICTKASDQSLLSINTQPDFTEVPVEFTVGSAGSYKITFGNIETFNSNQALYFEDKSTNSAINIRNTGVFVFSSDGSSGTGRFVLHFQEVGINEYSTNNLFVWSTGHTIYISAKTGILHIDQLDIMNMTGQCVISSANLNLPATIQQDNLSNGLYILKIKTRDGICVQKVLVR